MDPANSPPNEAVTERVFDYRNPAQRRKVSLIIAVFLFAFAATIGAALLPSSHLTVGDRIPLIVTSFVWLLPVLWQATIWKHERIEICADGSLVYSSWLGQISRIDRAELASCELTYSTPQKNINCEATQWDKVRYRLSAPRGRSASFSDSITDLEGLLGYLLDSGCQVPQSVIDQVNAQA